MPSHDPAPKSVLALIADRIDSGHYPDLVEAGVTVNALFAFTDDPERPAVKLHGYPCAAVIKINSAKDRLEGKSDATITIDGRAWAEEWSDDGRVALIEHELQHLIVARSKPTKRDPEARVLSDDAGRPKLKMRPHDFQIGGFVSIARRHGDESFERKTAAALRADFGPLLWPDESGPSPGFRVHDGGGAEVA
jgi:hypothetical protein